MKPQHEILLGIMNESGRVEVPRSFIQAAESARRMPDVDRWVIRNALQWMSENRRAVAKSGGYAINLSASTLAEDSLIDFVVERLSESSVPPAKVLFELREAIALASLTTATDFIRVLKEFGCRFSLDHFGTGDASFAYLKRLPVDLLKIDGSFVRQMTTRPEDLAVVKSVNEIGHFMGMQTVAEFVEGDEVLDQLREIGVDYAQGFGISKPALLTE